METVADLELRQRREKKELQAHIQGLKKIAKNDKTKKKELIADIARLEAEQEARHQLELSHVEEVSSKIENEKEVVGNDSEIHNRERISKAQKRRDKKQLQEKEQAALIKLQDEENKYGPRNIETQNITAKLRERKLKTYPIPSDGDCLYNALSHQLELCRAIHKTVGELRKNAADFIHSNKDDFIPFMSNPETYEMLSDEEFENYCKQIESTKAWGGQLEIRALSNSLKCPIHVIQATGPESIELGTEFDAPELIITYHRHLYSLGEHYNSTLPLDNACEEV